MNEIVIAGSHASALPHFAGYGLAAILGAAGARPIRLRWSDAAEPRLSVTSGFSRVEVGEAVCAHAEGAAAEDSWLNATIEAGSRAGGRLFSPRFKPPGIEEWGEIVRQRDDFFPSDLLDACMVVGLGEPSWWRQSEGGSPDAGASRWEMKTRNKGQEMVADRLVPLAVELANWTPVAVVDGLEGASSSDVVGKESADSRTASGFRQPGPTDNALAWCALWGIAATRPVRRVGGMAQTPGVWPRRATHPTVAALPVWTDDVSLEVVRRVLASAAFDDAAFAVDPLVRGAADNRLRTWGVRGVVTFPILKTGSTSAPERQILSGELRPLESR